MVIKQASQVIVMDGHLWQPQQLNFPTTTTYSTLQYNTATILLWTTTPSTAMIHRQFLCNILYECTFSDEKSFKVGV